MTLKIGIIGLGVMGADHANIIYSKTANANISAVYENGVGIFEISFEIHSRSTSPDPPAHPNSITLILLYPNDTASFAADSNAYA